MAAAAHESDLAMAELIQMAESEFSGALLIENYVSDTLDFLMSGDNDGRQNGHAFFESCIDEDESFDGAIHEEARVLFDEIGFAAVAGSEVEVAFFNEMFFYAA